MTTRIIMRTNDEENEDWYLEHGGDESHLIYANHERYGWSGVQAIGNAISVIAEAAGWEISIEYLED